MKPPIPTTAKPTWTQPTFGIVLGLVLLKLVIHTATNWQYGFHFDEFYYVAGGHHPAFGYVDHPPVTPLLARLFTGLLGESVSALRLAPAIAGGLIVFLTAWMARELRGRPSAQITAAALAVFCPAFLGAHTMFQTVTFNQLAWTTACAVLLRIATTGNARLWVLFGVVAGIGLMTKLTFGVLLVATAVGLLVTPHRHMLRTPWPWIGASISGLLFLPHVVWQVANDWPTLGFVREQAGVDWFFPGAASLSQLLGGGPALVPIVVAGACFYFTQRGEPYRLLGWTYLLVLLTFELLRGKFYYPFTMYPVLLSAGAIVVDRWVARRSSVRRRRLLIGAVVVNLVFAPLVLPVLPYSTLVRYGIPHTPDFDAMVGWTDLTETVVDVWQELPPDEKSSAVVLTRTYGTAGALDLYGTPQGLPAPVSGHNSYYLWGPGERPWDVVIAVGFPDRGLLDSLFGSVEVAARVPDAIRRFPAQQIHHHPIYVCSLPKAAPAELWPELRLNF